MSGLSSGTIYKTLCRFGLIQIGSREYAEPFARGTFCIFLGSGLCDRMHCPYSIFLVEGGLYHRYETMHTMINFRWLQPVELEEL